MSASAERRVTQLWYGGSPLFRLLLPLTWLFSLFVAVRRRLYAAAILKSCRVGVPVIVVGNISAGGTGKTPVTAWLAASLKKSGFNPGIVSRGYGGSTGDRPRRVTADSEPAVVGDEAILLAARCECPVVVHPDRVAAARMVVEAGADVVISDDGLQHYRLARDFEIAVVDGSRGFGNGALLPAGPLREPISRLADVDAVLVQRQPDDDVEFLRRATDRRPLQFRLKPTVVAGVDNSKAKPIEDFAGETVHAVAGIGNPDRFFRLLESYAIRVYRHPLPDHAEIAPADITFDDGLPVLMTEKDAVKCRWLDTRKCWYVPVELVFEGPGERRLLEQIVGVARGAASRR
jgi:tetraacyldisaccharide 4'-kinase